MNLRLFFFSYPKIKLHEIKEGKRARPFSFQILSGQWPFQNRINITSTLWVHPVSLNATETSTHTFQLQIWGRGLESHVGIPHLLAQSRRCESQAGWQGTEGTPQFPTPAGKRFALCSPQGTLWPFHSVDMWDFQGPGCQDCCWGKVSTRLAENLCLFLLNVHEPETGSPSGTVVKNPPANAGDVGSIPGLGRSPAERNGNPLQYSCLGNCMDRGAWQAIVQRFAESDVTEHAHTHTASKCRVIRMCVFHKRGNARSEHCTVVYKYEAAPWELIFVIDLEKNQTEEQYVKDSDIFVKKQMTTHNICRWIRRLVCAQNKQV